jgi:hypothetical protein
VSVGIETKIFRALTDHLDSFLVADKTAVAYPGSQFVPVPSKPFLRPALLLNPTLAFDLVRTNVYSGIFQISVFWPEQQGLVAPLEKASAVAAHFQRGYRLVREGIRVDIVNPPSVGSALQEPGWLQMPVSIPFRSSVGI